MVAPSVTSPSQAPFSRSLAPSGLRTRVAIVAGLRTPFMKQSTGYQKISALDLGKIVVSELMARAGISPKEIQQLVFGQVVPSVTAPNIAREIILGTGLPRTIEAFSVSRACATGYQSMVSVAEAINAGVIDCGIAGGADSASDVPMVLSKPLTQALMRLSKARTLGERLASFKGLRARDWGPIPPALKEISTGLTMGDSAEKMAKENHIARAAQDEFAHRSHSLAARAWASGVFEQQVMHVLVPPKYENAVTEDNLVRKESKLEAYTKLKPVFDKKYGTVTAGNSSPLTDGASAVLLMRDDKMRALGLSPLGYIRSYAFSALDPAGQMLMGPAYAAPMALDRAGVDLSHISLVDMHEAFAAQVLSNTQALESDAFAKEKLNRPKRIGEINWDAFNVSGGSIALGHPFAATGCRQVMQTLWELKKRGGGLGLCTACAAGGIGAAMIVEAAT